MKNVDVSFPLNNLTVITGVSGSGKSTLVKKILYPAMQKKLIGYGDKLGQHTEVKGSFETLKHIEFIDQNPIGRSSRSNPVTYIKAYDDIRKLLSSQKLSKIRNYQPKHFSFNVEGGRCEVCKGEGEVTIEMQFMADVHLQCEACNGKRFKKEVLEVTFEGKNIDDILNLTIDDAVSFFTEFNQPPDCGKLLRIEGNAANNVKGNPIPIPKPSIATVIGTGPSLIDPAKTEPSKGPVQEKETRANTTAINMIPKKPPISAALSALLVQLLGSPISKYPKNEMAKTIKIMKNAIFKVELAAI